MTKYIKNLTMVLLAALVMTSCDEVNKGTVGDTTVYFSNELIEEGFSAGFVYVPVRLDAGSEANSADVKVTIEVLDVQNATEDVEFLITSKELVFRPGVDSVALEVKVIPQVDQFDLRLGIASANTNVDQSRKECTLHVEKNTRDRLCDAWSVEYTKTLYDYEDLSSSLTITTSWSIANGCIEAYITRGLSVGGTYASIPFYFNYFVNQEGEGVLSIPTYKQLEGPFDLALLFEDDATYQAFVQQYGVQEDWEVYLYQMVVIPNNSANNPFLMPVEDDLLLEYDVESKTKTIKFADQSKKYTIGHSYELLDGDQRRMMSFGWTGTPIGNPIFTCK